MPRLSKAEIERRAEAAREATDDRSDYYSVGADNKPVFTKLGWAVVAIVAVLAAVGLGVVLF